MTYANQLMQATIAEAVSLIAEHHIAGLPGYPETAERITVEQVLDGTFLLKSYVGYSPIAQEIPFETRDSYKRFLWQVHGIRA